MDLSDLFTLADDFLYRHNELSNCEAALSQGLPCAPSPKQASQTQTVLDIVGDLRYLYRRAAWASTQVLSLAYRVEQLQHRMEACKDRGEELQSPAQVSLFLQYDVCSNTLITYMEYWRWAVHQVQTQAPRMTDIMAQVIDSRDC